MERRAARGCLALAAVAVTLAACGPGPYRFVDSETFVRKSVDPGQYRRAAVLYVGHAFASTALQKDAGAGALATPKEGTPSASLGSETYADDVVLNSNALIGALARRGVTMVERNRVNDLIREQGLIEQQLLDLSDIEQIRRLGKLLKVDLLVRGAVVAENGGWFLTPDLQPYYVTLSGLSVVGIDTRTGMVVWSDTTYLAQRITPRQIKRQPELGASSAVAAIVDEMVARFYQGGAL